MNPKILGIVGALIISLAIPSFALAGSGGRYHSKSGGGGGYDRGSRYERGQPYRSSSYHGRGYHNGHHGGYHKGYHKGYSHGGHYYGSKHHHHHKSHSSFSFAFGFGSYYP